MRLVVLTDPGTLEINYTWLPTWIGMNTALVQRLGNVLRKQLLHAQVSEATVAMAESLLLDALDKEFPYVDGLRQLLLGLHGVNIVDKNVQ